METSWQPRHLAEPQPLRTQALGYPHGSSISFLLYQMGRCQHLLHWLTARHHKVVPEKVPGQSSLAPPFLHPEQHPPRSEKRAACWGAC